MAIFAGNKLAESDKCWMYWIKSQPWVPHYLEKCVYVAPGGQERKEHELLAFGAIKREAVLWPRSWQFANGGLK